MVWVTCSKHALYDGKEKFVIMVLALKLFRFCRSDILYRRSLKELMHTNQNTISNSIITRREIVYNNDSIVY